MRNILMIVTSFIFFIPSFDDIRANDQLSRELPLFKQFCEVRQMTGFDWKQDHWEQVNFRGNKFILKKIVPPKSWQDAKSQGQGGTNAFMACDHHWLTPITTDGLQRYPVCVSKQALGEAHINYMQCGEFHLKGDAGWEVTLRCPNERLYFAPNGWFHEAFVHSSLEPVAEYKDSQYVSIGKCANIQ
jgi:hypothetical protein